MERERLEELVANGCTVREIAVALDVTPRTVAAWLREHGLRTERQRRAAEAGARARLNCRRHGPTTFTRKAEGGWRCLRCRSEAVARRRRRGEGEARRGGGGGGAPGGGAPR